jgi:hypothetical protein
MRSHVKISKLIVFSSFKLEAAARGSAEYRLGGKMIRLED